MCTNEVDLMAKKKLSERISEIAGIPQGKKLNRGRTQINMETIKRVVEANFELETKMYKIRTLLDDCYEREENQQS